MRGLACLAVLLLAAVPAQAHEKWANNETVPPWVQASCCGPDDVHHLTNGQVHATPEGWRIEGYPHPIPFERTLTSQDGDYWGFWRTYKDGSVSSVFCFFAPAQSF